MTDLKALANNVLSRREGVPPTGDSDGAKWDTSGHPAKAIPLGCEIVPHGPCLASDPPACAGCGEPVDPSADDWRPTVRDGPVHRRDVCWARYGERLNELSKKHWPEWRRYSDEMRPVAEALMRGNGWPQ